MSPGTSPITSTPRRPGVVELHLDAAGRSLPLEQLTAILQERVTNELRHAARVEVLVGAEDHLLWRAATRAGMRQEGVLRGAFDGEDGILLARLGSDADTTGPEGFTHILNSTLPRKRLIAQGLIRDARGRILLCELTYKRFWDLPGGVVDPDEPPAETVRREIREELDLEARIGRLAAVSWLPRWLGWDDATLLVFEATLPAGTEHARLLPREIAAVHWVGEEDLAAHVAPYTVAVVAAAVAALEHNTGAAYLENGVDPGERQD